MGANFEFKINQKVELGDLVTLEISEKDVVKAAFIAYIFPPIFMILGYIVTDYLGFSEMKSIIGSFIGLGIGFIGHAPAAMGRLNARGIPLAALAISCMGIAVAMVLNLWKPEQAFLLMMAISMFGAMFTWFMVFVTHWFFRRQRQRSQAPALPFQMWGFPWLTLLGAALMLAILLTTLFVPQFRMTLLVGVPFLLALTIAYQVHYRHRAPAAAAAAQE